MNKTRLTHYIPPAQKFIDLPREFIEPNPSDHFIYWLFSYRCISCKRPATEINEIVLRSRSNRSLSDWKNRVTMCQNCHSEYHHDGVTKEKVENMISLRKEYLISIGREQYV